MKSKIFFFAVVFLFPLFLYAENPSGETTENEKSTDTLFFMCGGTNIGTKGNVTLILPEKLAFTGNDIKYFNLKTEEIVFNNDSFVFDSLEFCYHCSTYNIYLNDKLLFENIVFVLPVNSMYFNNLVLYCDFGKLYLNDGYPNWKAMNWPPTAQMEEFQKIRDENAQKRKAEWDIFIKYLSDAGKIAGGPTAIAEPPATPELNAVSIYPNPTTGELRIVNCESRINDIKIFDAIGNKLPLRMKKVGGETDISHLPSGIYFVRITTEKGFVTKKVVKKR